MKILLDKFWKKWTLATAAGTLLGMGVVAVIAFAYDHFSGEVSGTSSHTFHLLAMVFAGAAGGLVLGLAQWGVLRQKFPKMTAAQWLGNTVSIIMICWFLGMLPAVLLSAGNAPRPPRPVEPSLLLILAGALALGLIMGAMFGLFQWLALRRHTRDSIQWVTANSLGWGLAMVFIFAAASWPDNHSPLVPIIASVVLAVALAGLSLGAVTGIYLNKIIAQNKDVETPDQKEK